MGNAQTVKRTVNGTVPVVLRTVQLSIKNIRKSIENLKIDHEKSKVSDYITASFGVINFSPSMELMNSDDVYNIADQNLYEAKKDGRNIIKINESRFTQPYNTL